VISTELPRVKGYFFFTKKFLNSERSEEWYWFYNDVFFPVQFFWKKPFGQWKCSDLYVRFLKRLVIGPRWYFRCSFFEISVIFLVMIWKRKFQYFQKCSEWLQIFKRHWHKQNKGTNEVWTVFDDFRMIYTELVFFDTHTHRYIFSFFW